MSIVTHLASSEKRLSFVGLANLLRYTPLYHSQEGEFPLLEEE